LDFSVVQVLEKQYLSWNRLIMSPKLEVVSRSLPVSEKEPEKETIYIEK